MRIQKYVKIEAETKDGSKEKFNGYIINLAIDDYNKVSKETFEVIGHWNFETYQELNRIFENIHKSGYSFGLKENDNEILITIRKN